MLTESISAHTTGSRANTSFITANQHPVVASYTLRLCQSPSRSGGRAHPFESACARLAKPGTLHLGTNPTRPSQVNLSKDRLSIC